MRVKINHNDFNLTSNELDIIADILGNTTSSDEALRMVNQVFKGTLEQNHILALGFLQGFRVAPTIEVQPNLNNYQLCQRQN